MLISSKFPKIIAGRTKCPRGLRVWDLCRRHCVTKTTLFLDIYLLRWKLHCNGLITIKLSVTVFINDFILTFRREKSMGQAGVWWSGNAWERHSRIFFTFCFEMSLKLLSNAYFWACVPTPFLLALRSWGQVITIRPVHSAKVLQLSPNVNCHPILL